MTGLQALMLGGTITAAGLVWAVWALRPTRPGLGDALAALAATPQMAAPPPVAWAAWLPAGLAGKAASRLRGRLGVAPEDLAILGLTAEQVTARKLALAGTGLVFPAVVSVAGAAIGLGEFAVIPAIAGLVCAAVGWWMPSADTREKAEMARVTFRANLEFFLTLVAGERRARGSVEQALSAAAEVSGTAPFVMMRREITRAELAGDKPWNALRDLAGRIGVAELATVADIAASAADGAAVYATLLAAARTIRHAERATARAEANNVSERLARPLSLLVFGLALFVLVPFMLEMFTAI